MKKELSVVQTLRVIIRANIFSIHRVSFPPFFLQKNSNLQSTYLNNTLCPNFYSELSDEYAGCVRSSVREISFDKLEKKYFRVFKKLPYSKILGSRRN